MLAATGEDHGVGADALPAAKGTQALGGCRLDIDSSRIDAEIGGNVARHFLYVASEPGGGGDDGRIHIGRKPIPLCKQAAYGPQQPAAVRTGECRVGIRKVATDVSERLRPEQGVADCMQQHVSVRMGYEARVVVNANPAEDDMISGTEGVHIVAVSYSQVRHLPSRNADARARSPGRVILILAGLPGTSSGE